MSDTTFVATLKGKTPNSVRTHPKLSCGIMGTKYSTQSLNLDYDTDTHTLDPNITNHNISSLHNPTSQLSNPE